MKKLFAILAVVSMVSFASCKSGATEPATEETVATEQVVEEVVAVDTTVAEAPVAETPAN